MATIQRRRIDIFNVPLNSWQWPAAEDTLSEEANGLFFGACRDSTAQQGTKRRRIRQGDLELEPVPMKMVKDSQ